MKKTVSLSLILFFVLVLGSTAFAQDETTRDEIVAKCKEAADLLLADRDAGIAEIANKEGRFVWKDTYVFLMDMQGNMLAHPIIPQLTKKGPLLDLIDKNKKKPKKIIVEFIDVAQKNGAGWVWYKWSKPRTKGIFDKFTYIQRVGYTDLIVGAGIYK